MKAIKMGVTLAIFFLVMASGTALARTINMKMAYVAPPKGPWWTGVIQPFADGIKERSDGELNIKIYPSGTLLKRKAQFTGIAGGTADFSWDIQVYNPGRFPLTLVMALPFLSPSHSVGTAVLEHLYYEFPEIRAEFDKVKVLWFWGTMPNEIHTTKKPVRKLEDLKGMKIACNAGTAQIIKGLGGVPVVIVGPEIYQSLEKGVVDGVVAAYGAFNSQRYYEVTKYHTNAHLGGMTTAIIMNKDRYESLSKEHQEIIDGYSVIGRNSMVAWGLKQAAPGVAQAKSAGHEWIELSKTERARWVATANPAWEAWVKKVEAKGLPGQEILDRAVELVELYSD